MKFILKILSFTALLLISKFTKEDKLITTPAENPQVIVSTGQKTYTQQLPIHKTSGKQPGKTVQALVTTQATIK